MSSINWLPSNISQAWNRLTGTSPLKNLLVMQGNPAYCSKWEDFIGDAVDALHPSNGGTGTQVVGITVAPNGTLTIASQGNQATDSAIQSLWDLNWNGDNGLYMASRVKLSTLTNCKFNLGVSDEQTDTGAVNSKANATFNVSDCAVFSFDTADDTKLTLQTNGGSTDLNYDTDFTMAADTFTVFEIKIQDNHTSFYVNGRYVGGGAETVEGGTAMRPFFYVEQNDTAAITGTWDWNFITGPRL